MRKKAAFLFCVITVIFLSLCPFFLNFYWLRILSNIFIFAILTQGLNIITGYTGYPAFGNVVFFGLGAYSTGILMVKWQSSFIASMGAGVLVCAIFTLVFGLPLLRLKGHYFAIATLGLNEATRAITDNLTDLTGGGMGLSLPLRAGDITVNTLYFYFLLYGTMLLSILVTFFLVRGRFGYACRAIRADEETAESMGVNTTRYKTLAWMISAVFTGIAGSIYAYWMTYIDPATVFDMTIAIKAFVMLLLGGAGTLLGPIVGAFFLETISTLTWSHFLNVHIGTLGAIVMLIVIFMPKGFIFFLTEKFSLSAIFKDREDRRVPNGN